MTQDEIIELAIQGHASTRDAIRWAINQERERLTDAAMKAAEKAVDVAIKLEREACAKLVEDSWMAFSRTPNRRLDITPFPELEYVAKAIRARGQA
jgi:hypothetical protein